MITILKKDLDRVAKFLVGIELSGVENIHRMRIVNVLKKQHEEIVAEEVELLKAHAEVDSKGELVRSEGGGFRLKDQESATEFREQQEKLFEESFVIDNPNYKQALETLEGIIMNLDQKLSNEDAEIHFLVVEAFEQAKEEKGDDE
ncbi:hypothetical protein [Shouchella patagoniensis]|uniref:hypothetical protein n=1 Tax=Shouchella patagoniensis TaxID=228576 RepID=UPI000994C084|nr:hypothetical protein [Shouchella patagoniensis]